ncbi:MAG: hypothetical protein ABI353_16760, partial [Isosphaeraceae bacterium]
MSAVSIASYWNAAPLCPRRHHVVGSIAMSVDELQSAIVQLSAEDLDHLSRWLDEYRADLWDRRIEA